MGLYWRASYTYRHNKYIDKKDSTDEQLKLRHDKIDDIKKDATG